MSLLVYDVSGRMIRVLREGVLEQAVHRQVVWNGRDDANHQVPAGVYFYLLKAGKFSETKRMTLVK